MYIYIYREREREQKVYIYIYIYMIPILGSLTPPHPSPGSRQTKSLSLCALLPSGGSKTVDCHEDFFPNTADPCDSAHFPTTTPTSGFQTATVTRIVFLIGPVPVTVDPGKEPDEHKFL